jgi:hypothetical protein
MNVPVDGQKARTGSAFPIMGEVVRRYGRFLDPRGWFGKGRG